MISEQLKADDELQEEGKIAPKRKFTFFSDCKFAVTTLKTVHNVIVLIDKDVLAKKTSQIRIDKNDFQNTS